MSVISTNPLWRRPVLLSLVRSELALDQLKKTAPILFEGKGVTAPGAHSDGNGCRYRASFEPATVQDPDYQKITEGLYIPEPRHGQGFILWLLMEIESLPVPAIPRGRQTL